MRFLRHSQINPVVLDLGSSMTRIFYRGKLIFVEPSFYAKKIQTNEIVAIGEMAKKLEISPTMSLLRPIRQARINDVVNLKEYVSYIIGTLKFNGFSLPKKSPILSYVGLGLSSVERQRWQKLWRELGSSQQWLLPQTTVLAMYLAKKYRLTQASCLDLGESSSRLVMFVDGMPVYQKEFPWGMSNVQERLDQFLLRENLLVDEKTSQDILQNLLSLKNNERQLSIKVKQGLSRNLTSVRLQASEFKDLIKREILVLSTWLMDAYALMSHSEKECWENNRVVLVGGGANLDGLASELSATTNIKVVKGDDAEFAHLLGMESWYEQENKGKE